MEIYKSEIDAYALLLSLPGEREGQVGDRELGVLLETISRLASARLGMKAAALRGTRHYK